MSTSNLALQPYDTRAASDREYAALHAFFQQLAREERPDDPPFSLEHFTAMRRHPPSFVVPAGFALWDGDVIAAIAEVWTYETEDNQHAADVRIMVLPEHRQRGLACRLLACIVQVAEERNRRLLIGRTASTIPAGEAFMQRLGAKPGLPVHTNQLVLAELDRGRLQRWVEQGQQRASDFELGLWEGPFPEADLEAIARLWKVMNQAPRGDLDLEDFVFTPDYLRQMDAALLAQGTTRWTIYARARTTGAFAGYTEVYWFPRRPMLLYQGATGVFPEHRNRGLGRWLKAAMLDKVLRELPQAQRVHTTNANVNAPMLKINTELGFKPYLAETIWQVETARVLEYLGAGAQPMPAEMDRASIAGLNPRR